MIDGASAVRIDGHAIDPREPVLINAEDPLTGQPATTFHGGGFLDFAAAAASAHRALDGWQQTPPQDRAESLRRIADRLETARNELAHFATRETGKRVAESEAEVSFAARYFRWYADVICADASMNVAADAAQTSLVLRRPLGLILVVTPWNFPLSIPARKLAPLLAAGCTAVFKPSEVAPGTSLLFAELVDRELPAGVVNTVVSSPNGLDTKMLEDHRIRGLTFTGSTRVGQLFAQQAAASLQRSVLELGGNAPFIVLDDADLDDAEACLRIAKFRNNGQSCIAANQAWVHRSVADELFERITSSAARLTMGDPLNRDVDLGPLALPSDPDRLSNLLETLMEDGADVAACRLPSDLPGGHFVAPAVCRDPDPASRAWQVEAFGPLLMYRSFDAVDEVIDATNRSAVGLAAYICTRDVHRGARLGSALEVGVVGINTATPNDVSLPFGGMKASGWGREGGRAGLEPFLEHQMIRIQGAAPQQ